jgi:5,10-methylenetetrahydromethanopterin reductase
VREAAAASERIGFDELWLVEDYFFTGAISAATAALSATERLPVGIGIVSAMVRHPAILAMEIATIARMYPGRFRPGIGLGVPAWLDQMGLRPKTQLSALRDCFTAVRDLLAGEAVTRNAFFRFNGISLTYPPAASTPLYMGVLARKAWRSPARSPTARSSRPLRAKRTWRGRVNRSKRDMNPRSDETRIA